MTEMILDLQTVPEVILSKISVQKVRLLEDNGVITLTPLSEEKSMSEEKSRAEKMRILESWCGRFADGSMSVDDFLETRRREG